MANGLSLESKRLLDVLDRQLSSVIPSVVLFVKPNLRFQALVDDEAALANGFPVRCRVELVTFIPSAKAESTAISDRSTHGDVDQEQPQQHQADLPSPPLSNDEQNTEALAYQRRRKSQKLLKISLLTQQDQQQQQHHGSSHGSAAEEGSPTEWILSTDQSILACDEDRSGEGNGEGLSQLESAVMHFWHHVANCGMNRVSLLGNMSKTKGENNSGSDRTLHRLEVRVNQSEATKSSGMNSCSMQQQLQQDANFVFVPLSSIVPSEAQSSRGSQPQPAQQAPSTGSSSLFTFIKMNEETLRRKHRMSVVEHLRDSVREAVRALQDDGEPWPPSVEDDTEEENETETLPTNANEYLRQTSKIIGRALEQEHIQYGDCTWLQTHLAQQCYGTRGISFSTIPATHDNNTEDERTKSDESATKKAPGAASLHEAAAEDFKVYLPEKQWSKERRVLQLSNKLRDLPSVQEERERQANQGVTSTQREELFNEKFVAECIRLRKDIQTLYPRVLGRIPPHMFQLFSASEKSFYNEFSAILSLVQFKAVAGRDVTMVASEDRVTIVGDSALERAQSMRRVCELFRSYSCHRVLDEHDLKLLLLSPLGWKYRLDGTILDLLCSYY